MIAAQAADIVVNSVVNPSGIDRPIDARPYRRYQVTRYCPGCRKKVITTWLQG